MEQRKLKVIIADDERLIIALIHKMIDFDALEIEVVGECLSGTAVLKMIKKERPDIVITDICMPGCDGLEMINRANNLGIHCEYILISGHKNFEYAHTAIKYGIRNYLLKPLNQNELYENLLDVKHRILESRNKEEEKILLGDRTKKSEKFSKKCFMQDFFEGSLPNKGTSLKDLNEYYMTKFEEGVFFVIAIKPDIKGKMDHDQYNIILEQIEEYFYRHLKFSYIDMVSLITKQLFFIINAKQDEDLDNILLDLFGNAKIRFGDYCMLTIGVSKKYDFPRFAMIEEASKALIERLDRGVNCIIDYDTIGAGKTDEKFFNEDIFKQLASYIEVANQQACKLWFEEQRQKVSNEIMAMDYTDCIHSLIDFIDKELRKLFKSDEDFKKMEMHESIFHDMTRYNMLNNVEQWLEQTLRIYIAKKEEQKQWYIRMSKKYVADNYKKNICLNDIANQLHINSSYFSMLFKKEEGINFINYLIAYRMDLAKTLLKDPKFSISQVGNMVGYDDSSYFSKRFKKVVGVRPKVYRKLYM